MKLLKNARVLRIYVGDQDQYRGGPLHAALVKGLRAIGLEEITVLHGVEGYGGHRELHTQRIEVLFQGLPVVIEAIDSPEQIELAQAVIDEILTEGLVVTCDVESVRYVKDSQAPGP
ncbi:MAG: DUF190 domain-containing protein [Capsulimonadaceae bacterium]|nr:DUF190 domain-containing protein [Capsulimonadaceae bacterium]